jgi:hypothetical protein
MKPSKTRKRISRNLRELFTLQVRQYIERYPPKLRNCVVIISPCGTVRACVRFTRTLGSKFPFILAIGPELRWVHAVLSSLRR